MAELKFIKPELNKRTSACCGPAESMLQYANESSVSASLPVLKKNRKAYVTGSLMTDTGAVPVISTDITRSDYWEHVKCRASAFRNTYTIDPGLYAVGSPDKNSDVLVSANYKLSFDALRKALKGISAWILALDTKGINVWCAAGKGTFGTDELIRRISITKLDKVVSHRKIIVPQLGAPGISAHKVLKASGFRVCYGPVRAEDIGPYIASEYMATGEMRTVTFPFIDRLILTPMEINPAMKKYYPWFALITLAVFGLQPGGIFFRGALFGGLPFLLLGLISIFAGALVTPALLPFIPFRSFAVKGWITGMLLVIFSAGFAEIFNQVNTILLIFTYLFFPLASSYIALQFTGSTTFTGMSGVKKELRIGIPLYIGGLILSGLLLSAYKLQQWGVL
ncbi:MAG: acetyl-CoA synthase subunit gamma [Nitrospirae bacterium]|nr:acetyl-CoA synthase subunit gamma [Nitrospirota bacterium]